mmetsp:Transcript_8949/g.31584  ORF Transcript_8949/g.31584 Transcript_8949/m.31584 type:complete len:254 (-) Transcript_8949:193-954(-)
MQGMYTRLPMMTSIKSSTVAFVFFTTMSALCMRYSRQIDVAISMSRWSCWPLARYVTPPFSLRCTTISGGSLFSRMPKPSSSCSMMRLCVIGLLASSTIRMTLHVRAVPMTCRPRPLPSLAPSMIPGRSSSWILAPLYRNTPGMAVRVVNSYAAASDSVPVSFVNSVDLPTEGKPTSPTRVSPLLLTSKPSPAPPPLPLTADDTTSAFSFARRAFSSPRCFAVALFFCVRAISSSISLIFCRLVEDMVAGGGW